MKKLIALFVVAILATSVSFAQETGAAGTGTGTVNINVEWVNINVIPVVDEVNLNMYPGSQALDQEFVWNYTGSPGIDYIVSGLWTTALDEDFFTVTGDLNHTNGTFGNLVQNFWGYGTTVKYIFDVVCKPGTPRSEDYQGVYTLTVAYN